MHRAVKWVLIGVASLLAVIGLAVAYVAATFDPNDYKGYLIQAVKERTGRTLQLKGTLGLTFYPTLGMKLGEASLSERDSDREFARVAEALVAVKLIPLLSKKVIVDAIEVKGLRATIARDKSGRYNFHDMAGTEGTKPKDQDASPLKIDIDHIEVADGDVTYVDQSAGAQYRLSKLNMKTGRVAAGVTTPVELSALVTSATHKAQLDTQLRGKLTLDLEREIYKLDGLDFSTRGNFDTFSGLSATTKGSVEARLASGEYIARDLVATLTGKQAGADLKVNLDTPKLTLTKDKVDGGKLALEASRTEGRNRLLAKVTLGAVNGTFTAVDAGPLDAQIEMHGDDRVTKAQLSGALTGNLEATRFELPKLALNAAVSNPKLPRDAFVIAINGVARADLARETASLEFSGKLDQSNVNGKAALRKFSPLAVSFEINADQLDADRLLGKPGSAPHAKQAKSGEGAARTEDDKIDLSALKGIDAAGSVKIGRLMLLNLNSSQVRADVKVANGRLDVAPLAAQLYRGTLNGSLSAQAAADPVFAVRQQLSGVEIGPLLRDAANIDTLDAKGTVNVDLTTRGATLEALKKALAGTAAVNFADGSLKGIDIAGAIRTARTQVRQLRGEQVQESNKAQKTDFSELKATFNVKNGVAYNNDLSMKSPLLRAAGEGSLDIGNDRLNYLLKATVVGTSKGQGGKDLAELSGLTVPVKLTGPLDSPQYAIDFGGMAVDFATRQLEAELLRRATGKSPGEAQPSGGAQSPGGSTARDVIKDGLKGIFGR